MDFNVKFKPTVITGYGVLSHAKERFRNSINGCFSHSSKFGSAYVDSFKLDVKYVYAYNIEVFKRGKHRGPNRHYVIYKYTFPIELFKLLHIEIEQGNRTFKIKSRK